MHNLFFLLPEKRRYRIWYSSTTTICRLWLQSAPVSVSPVLLSVVCGSSLLLYLSFVAPVSVVLSYGSSISCRLLCLQYLSVVHGSSIVCRLWLQYQFCRSWLQSPVVSVVVHDSSICRPTSGSSISCRSWLQYLLSFVAPVAVVALSLVNPAAVVRGSSIICRLWLPQQYLLLSRLVAPVSTSIGFVVHGSSLQSLLSFMAPVSSICCRSWLQYLSFVAPVSNLQYLLSFMAPVSCTICRSWLRSLSSICRSWLRYLLLYLSSPPVAPASVAHGSTTSICRL